MRFASLAVFTVLIALAACAPTEQPLNQTDNQTLDPVERIAEDFVRDTPTFAYDGQDLQLVSHDVLESFPEQHVLTFTFTSTHAGYGDRSDEVVAQVLTDHEIVVTVVEDEVTSAVIDDRWDAIEQRMLDGSVQVMFQPMQCETTPWDQWYADGGIQYVTEPTDEQLIQDYYAQVHGIALENVERDANEDRIVCEACSVCPTQHSFTAGASADALDALQEDEWVQLGPDTPVSN